MLTFEQEMYVRFASDAMKALLTKKTYERSDNRGQPRIPNEVGRLAFDAADLMMEEFHRRQIEQASGPLGKKKRPQEEAKAAPSGDLPLSDLRTPEEKAKYAEPVEEKKSVGQKADSLSPTQRAKLLKANPLKRGMKARF